jgi:hypothetical protein
MNSPISTKNTLSKLYALIYRILYKELKRKYEQDKEEAVLFSRKYLKSDNKEEYLNHFEDESYGFNATQCYKCGIDPFTVYVCNLNNKDDAPIYCIRCAANIVDSLRASGNEILFYHKYQDSEMEIFFRRLENKIKDPHFIDTGCQNTLLLKSEWPKVVIKEDLIGKENTVLFYKNPESYNIKYASSK